MEQVNGAKTTIKPLLQFPIANPMKMTALFFVKIKLVKSASQLVLTLIRAMFFKLKNSIFLYKYNIQKEIY